MQLTKKNIEKKYGVILEREQTDLCSDYKSWTAYKCEQQVAWQYTLKEIVEELESKIDELKDIEDEYKEVNLNV